MSHDARKSLWLEAVEWLQQVDRWLPAQYPAELPPDTTKDFWFQVARFEMSTRDEVSAKLRAIISGLKPSDLSSLDCWFFRRRFEWAGQLALAKVQESIEPQAALPEVLDWMLVQSWESAGCIGMWNHAERDGKAHPENPDGLSPI